jgi:perosamine synthetase
MYSILIEDEYGKSRDETISLLAEYGIETRPFFYPMHILPNYKDNHFTKFPNADSIASKGINLPMFYELEEDDIKLIADVLRKGKIKV